MMRKYGLLISIITIIALCFMGGCGTKSDTVSSTFTDSITPGPKVEAFDDLSNYLQEADATITPAPQNNEVMVTPTITPVIEITEAPSVTTASQEPNDTNKSDTPKYTNEELKTIAEFENIYGELDSYAKWIICNEGKEYRINGLSEWFGLSSDDIKSLMNEYYTSADLVFCPINFSLEDEINDVSNWLMFISSNTGITFEDAISLAIENYNLGILTLVDGTYYLPAIDYYSTDTISYSSAISANGDLLQVGDKVKYDGVGLIYYGGTVYEIDGSNVKVRWEVRGDMFTFPSGVITEEEKSPAKMMLNFYGMPSDDELIEAAVLTKVSYLLW